jgi:elongation of very long chain fatty acids protein 4
MTTLKITVPYKAYITQIQMTQFLLNFIQACYCVTHNTPNYPTWLGWLLFGYMITLLALFYNFYRKNLSAAARARAKNAQLEKDGKKSN